MTKTYLLSIAVLLSSLVNAQQVKITWGEEGKKELEFRSLVNGPGNDMVKLSFENHGGYFQKKTSTPFLFRYDGKLSESNVREYKADEDGIRFNNLVSVKNKIFLFSSQYDKSNKSTAYFCQAVNPSTLNPEGSVINLGSFDAKGKNDETSISFQLSKDSSKIMLFGLSPYSKKENEKYYMAVYDNTMHKLWDNTVELPYKDKYIKVLSKAITSDGKVGVIIKHYDQDVTKESVKGDAGRVPSYKAKFLLYENGVKNPTEYVLNINDKFIETLTLSGDSNGDLSLFGLYKGKHNGHINGYFLADINKDTKAITTKKMETFPEELVELVKKDKQASDKEKDPGLYDEFDLVQVVERADGSKDYLLEYYKVIEHSSSSSSSLGGMTRTTDRTYYEYNFGDIIDINVKKSGPTLCTRIPKLQISYSHAVTTSGFGFSFSFKPSRASLSYGVSWYSSFKALPYKDKLLLFYNDDRDNVDRDITKRPDDVVKFGRSVLMMATVDTKGGVSRQSLLDHKKMDLTTCVNESCVLDNNRIGLYALRGAGVFSAARDMVGILEVR
jgi:hypothetical protein